MSRWFVGVLLAAVFWPGGASALGFGDIRLKSALNAPLDAEIEIVATPEELGSVRASLASRDQFARNGMEYPAFLNSATVRLAKSADGRDVLQVRTTDPVTEPFLTMLVQVSYARGQLIREYTVLLDPPVFAGQSASPAVNAPTAGNQARTGDVNRAAPAVAAAASPAAVSTTAAFPAATGPAAVAPAAGNRAPAPGDRTYRVRPGDTLSGIARANYPGVNREAALVGLYQANPAAFDGNMNSLQNGALLTLPAEGDLARVAPAQARTEVGRQYRSWAEQHGAGPGRLRLVPPADNAARPAPDATASDLQRRVADLEQQLAEKDRLLTLRNAELARLQQRSGAATSGAASSAPAPAPATRPGAAAPAPAPAPAAASSSSAASVVAPPIGAPPRPAARPQSAPTSEPSLLERLMEDWYVPVAAAAVLAALAGLALVVRSRRSRTDYSDRNLDHFGATAGAMGESSQTLPARQLPDVSDAILVEETGSHRHGDSVLPAPTIAVSDDGGASEEPASSDGGLEQGDPLAEADFHMAYGLYDQAAELVNQAIAREPERRELKLKLLEVYFVWGNKAKFEQLATGLHATREGAMPGEWEKIVIMGRQIAPENSLFASAGSVAGATGGSVDLNLEGGQNRVDFNLMGEPTVVPGDLEGDDLRLAESLGAMPGVEAGSRPPGESGVDFLLDTPVRGEGGELHTQMMPAASGRDRTVPPDGPTSHLPQLDMPEQPGTVRLKLDAAAARPAGGDMKDNTAELALDDLGLDIGTLESAAVSDPNPAGDEEEIVLHTDGDLIPELEAGAEADWLRPGIGDAAPDADVGADGTRAYHEPAAAEEPLQQLAAQSADATAQMTAAEPMLASGQSVDDPLLQAEIDAALSGLALPESGGTTVGHIEALAQPEQATQEMAAGTQLMSGIGITSAITAVMPAAAEYPEAATSRLSSLGLSDADIDAQIGVTRAMPVTPAGLQDPDPPTMSEVGTKLDLARAYMDMGDPEGARSILDEVLTEGSASQKQEARRLIESLPG